MNPIHIIYAFLLHIESLVMAAGMIAGGTGLWGLGAFKDISADHTLPLDRFLTLPYGTFLDLLEVSLETQTVMLLDLGNGAEM